jgi:hypothetical protein
VDCNVKKEVTMRQEKKLSLEELKVQSFSTTLTMDEQKAIKAGNDGDLEVTYIKVFC